MTDRTCYFCHRRVADVAKFWWVDDVRHICICHEHKDFEGRHGELAERRPQAHEVAAISRLLVTSTPRGARKRFKEEPESEVIIKKETDELEVGEVVDEVAAFLKKMGKM